MGIKEQHESLDELAALTDDRDKWQARAKQAEGRVATLGQELAAVTANRDGLGNRIHETESERDQWRARWMQADTKAASLAEELAAATRQLEAAVTAPDLRGDLERVAAERDEIGRAHV